MRKFAVLFAALWLLLAMPATQAEASYYWFQIKDENQRPITSGFNCQVITVASQTHDVVFTNNTYDVQKTNPVNPNSQGVISFATSASTVDVSCWGQSGISQGATAKLKSGTETDHVIVMNTNDEAKHLRIFWDSNISKGAEVNTGIDLPIGALVDDAWIEVATAAAFASVSVGLLSTDASGDADGFCRSQGADFAQPPGRFFRCEASATVGVTGAGQRFNYSSSTRGVLLGLTTPGNLSVTVNGTDIASLGQNREFSYEIKPGGSRRVTYMTNDRGAAGYIHLWYRELRRR